MTEDHISRLAAPKSWKIKRKGIKFVTKPRPGAHSQAFGLPINVLMRDLIGVVKTTREVKYVIFERSLLVDNKKISDSRFVVGLMDSVSLPDSDTYFRILLDTNGKIYALPIDKAETALKICKITGKSLIKKKVQLNLHDGRNIFVDKDVYKVGDSVLLDLPKQVIKSHVKFEKGTLVFMIGGKLVGRIATVEGVDKNKLIVKIDDKTYEGLKNHAFVIGKEKSLVKVS